MCIDFLDADFVKPKNQLYFLSSSNNNGFKFVDNSSSLISKSIICNPFQYIIESSPIGR